MKALVEATVAAHPQLPLDHMTRVGLLLEWSVIKKLIGPYLEEAEIPYISEYPVEQEKGRDSLILHSRNEVSFSSRQVSLPTDHGCSGLVDPPFAASMSPTFDGGFIEINDALDFTEPSVCLYVQTFKQNILSMHPIIGPKDLDSLVSEFLKKMLGSQRKRPQFGDGSDENNAPQIQAKQLERSSTSAMVLLVLALGEVCLHIQKIPGHNPPQKCTIPGLEYFSYATDILGNLLGSYNDMMDIRANILAGLFYGQLSRPMQSFEFVYQAGHKLLVIIGP
jgi:hypothetical protein